MKLKKMNLENIIGKHYDIDMNESELKGIEEDLEKVYGCYVKAGYDAAWSHKYNLDCEQKARSGCDFPEVLDWVINYELYQTYEDKEANLGGFDGEVHELHYLVGNGDYIVIT